MEKETEVGGNGNGNGRDGVDFDNDESDANAAATGPTKNTTAEPNEGCVEEEEDAQDPGYDKQQKEEEEMENSQLAAMRDLVGGGFATQQNEQIKSPRVIWSTNAAGEGAAPQPPPGGAASGLTILVPQCSVSEGVKSPRTCPSDNVFATTMDGSKKVADGNKTGKTASQGGMPAEYTKGETQLIRPAVLPGNATKTMVEGETAATATQGSTASFFMPDLQPDSQLVGNGAQQGTSAHASGNDMNLSFTAVLNSTMRTETDRVASPGSQVIDGLSTGAPLNPASEVASVEEVMTSQCGSPRGPPPGQVEEVSGADNNNEKAANTSIGGIEAVQKYFLSLEPLPDAAITERPSEQEVKRLQMEAATAAANAILGGQSQSLPPLKPQVGTKGKPEVGVLLFGPVPEGVPAGDRPTGLTQEDERRRRKLDPASLINKQINKARLTEESEVVQRQGRLANETETAKEKEKEQKKSTSYAAAAASEEKGAVDGLAAEDNTGVSLLRQQRTWNKKEKEKERKVRVRMEKRIPR